MRTSKAYITTAIRLRYDDTATPFDLDESARNYDIRSIRLIFDDDTTTTKN